MGEAGFSCPRCAELMSRLSWGEYGCNCGERVYAAGYASEPVGAVAVPSSPAEVERWLRAYPAWLETLEGAGYYGVAPDIGTRIQSNRAGRPTERTALLFSALVAQCRAVEAWLARLTALERRLADWYIAGATVPTLCDELGMTYWQVHGAIRRIPRCIWAETCKAA